ncbi:MAG TPA: glucosyl-3-phosphoglycerate synthase [Acidimicrobiales bacterium]|nr:glucosyl-3-phosphoglycerate synthase [Acidimicrobiales bacterium]
MPVPFVRTFHHRHVDLDAVVEAKRDHVVSVCIPARDEEATVGRIVRTIRRELVDQRGLVDEVVVVDDGSTDNTAAAARDAGARVIAVDDVLPECGPGQGKGEAMWKGLAAAEGDLVAFCDADVRNFGPRFVVGLIAPLLADDDIGFVKAFYQRPLDGETGAGGRVTELVARPLISLLFPHLSPIVQPLAGECAGRREVLEQVPFVSGYGVDLGLLIDVSREFGLASMAQVDLGIRHHRNRPLDELGPQAMAIMQTAFLRSGVSGREWSNLLVRPDLEPVRVETGERPPLVNVPAYRKTA